jgi:hypothetical protein
MNSFYQIEFYPSEYRESLLNNAQGEIMIRKTMVLSTAFILMTSVAATAQTKDSLSAKEIADRNVEARGGLQAWRAVQAIKVTGNLDAGGNNRPTLAMPGKRSDTGMPKPRPTQQIQLPFVMESKRPRMTRMEIAFKGQTALQVFDGTNGWKLRPFLNRMEVEPYTDEEMKTVALQSELDGPIIDYAAKGTTIELEGTEKVENNEMYKLKLTFTSGQVTYVWIDAKTFLETKMEGAPRRMDGKLRPVEVYFRDYRRVSGLEMPYMIETMIKNVGVPGMIAASSTVERINVDKIDVNPPLAESLFSKAQLDSIASGKTTSASAMIK